MTKKIPVNSPCPCGSGKKYKKCCGNPMNPAEALFVTEKSPSPPLCAYTDESGNTGNNLFDKQQPFFWTGSLISEADLNLAGAEVHKECLALAGVTELHGNELGFGGIEKIANKLEKFFVSHRCRFLVTRIEKEHVAATKFVDTVMDSGINKAVSPLHYGIRGLRLPLALALVQVLTDADRRQFWDAYGDENVVGFGDVVNSVRRRIALSIYDPRTTELLTDALDWAAKNPQPLLEGGRSELDAPNVIAFTLVVSMFHHINEDTGAIVGKFIHDEQNQFARFLKESYQALRGFAFENTILSAISDMKKVPTFACEMQIESSRASIGLQFTDVLLWLIKRHVDSEGRTTGNCAKLAKSVVRHGLISDFSLAQLRSEFQKIKAYSKAPLSAEKEKAGRKLFREVELRRKERMLESDSKE
jgi:hypothetical protein